MAVLEAADFAGRWQILRKIADRAGGADGVLVGQAAFAADDGGLAYHETGTLRLAGGPEMNAERRYLWRFGPDGVRVLFADGRPFHGFVPEGKAAGTEHLCGADMYRVQYDFTRWPQWQAVWQVTGPRKDYTSTTTFTKAR